MLPLFILLPGAVATKESNDWQSAVCADHVMTNGIHYVEVTICKQGNGIAFVGVVGAGYQAFSGDGAAKSTEGWMLGTRSGPLVHAGCISRWEGQPRHGALKEGDVVGLLLDCGQRTLAVYFNRVRCGVMVKPGMKNSFGNSVATLSMPLRWAVDLSSGTSVSIASAQPPPG